MVRTMRSLTLCLSLIWAVALVGPAYAQSSDPFYQGKMLRFIVGVSAGGGFDTYTRLLARHVGKHIPGNPSTIVANMPGAGHLIAANYMYAKAKPDGLTIGNWVGGLVFKQVAGQGQGIRFDARKFVRLRPDGRTAPRCRPASVPSHRRARPRTAVPSPPGTGASGSRCEGNPWTT